MKLSVFCILKLIVIDPGMTPLEKRQLMTEESYLEAIEEYGDEFEAGWVRKRFVHLLKKLI